MTNEELINNEKYHTCGRCKHNNTPDNEYPCVSCTHGTDYRTDLWELEQLDEHNHNHDVIEEVAKMEYERGLNDAWECARKIVHTSSCDREMNNIFGDDFYYAKSNILNKYSASDAIAKIKEYEEKQK